MISKLASDSNGCTDRLIVIKKKKKKLMYIKGRTSKPVKLLTILIYSNKKAKQNKIVTMVTNML